MSPPYMDVHFQLSTQLIAWALGFYALFLQGTVVRCVRANDRDAGLGWWLGGALCVGTGFWAQALLNLVALQLPIRVGFVAPVVMAAWMPAVVISAAAIWMQTRTHFPQRLRLVGGLLVALGLCLLTFIHASAIMFQPGVSWDVWRLAGALLLTLAGCLLGSLAIRRSLVAEPPWWRRGLLVLGISALFNAGQVCMAWAMQVPTGAVCLSVEHLAGEGWVLVLCGAVLMLMIMGHLSMRLDARARRRQQALVDSLKEAQAALDVAAQHDPLTGLLNRVGFERMLHQGFESPSSPAVGPLCVMRLHVDGVRTLTETYGHAHSDQLMRHLALRLQAAMRGGDVLAHAESDEFLMLSRGLSDEHELAQLAQRLSAAVHEPCLIEGNELTVSASIGIARYPESFNARLLLAHASDAMLTARKAGGGVYCFHRNGEEQVGVDQVALQRDLRHAIARDELMLHFQPKLCAGNGELSGVEALLRWQHPVRGLVSPATFIPVAERFGLIGELGLWVLDAACRQMRLWHEAGVDVPVAVNLSAHQLRQPDLAQRVREVLLRHRVPPAMLILEITESVAMDDIEASMRMFDQLDDIGVQLSIDDFGTGYSSLSYLRRLPARQLKIDRSFIGDLESSADAQAIVEAVVRLAHALGLKVVGEGVETLEQAAILTRLQCDELQGYLFARPMPAHALLVWLGQRGAVITSPLPQHGDVDAQAGDGLTEGEVLTTWSDLGMAPLLRHIGR
ncbi:bifunctional diguanylate cyclase/phosphodiesterase [Aquabacterium sp.]|uniref:putative bifunctional diguanylate cyclase/phosphodiesterase n=1 Tax=Aquabacterium sp. TaxID=1872578 RepID=UPI00267B3AC8|nr:EAL domain-containing protein [Aquabacterium sp.]